MHASRLAAFVFFLLFAASALTVPSATYGLTTPIPPPDFTIKVVSIAYNVTSINGTAANGTATVTDYDRAELEITFSSAVATEYINSGYTLLYDIRYKDHSKPEMLTGWHTIFDNDDYPEQSGGRTTTAHCSILYPSSMPNLDFQARTITAHLVTRWHFERVDNKWVRVSQEVLEAAGSSEWSSSQMLTGLGGYAPVTPSPPSSANQPTPTASPSPSPTASPTPTGIVGAIMPTWIQLLVMALLGAIGSIIVVRGVFVWWRGKPETAG
ncbi:MAG: hypothetical protein NWE93_14260 [Candidatus Bathyarchaeota archaeon]|nr:hypothetical protein [Candidatus Bathyarchaeota archaeon]